MRRAVLMVMFGLAVPGPALAQAAGPRIHAGDTAVSWLTEIRGGAIWHDPGARESSAALNGEILFATPIPARLTADIAPVWRWMLEPRPHLGFTANLEGYTSKGYAGLTWTAMLATDLLRPGDGIRFDFFFGGGLNDGKHNARLPDRKDLGGNLLFRVGGELGYQLNNGISLSLFLDHDSNGGTAKRNQGLNSVGLRLGYAL